MLDFPSRVASLVFTGSCNLTRPFCHNAGLVLDPDSYPDYPLDELLADLKKREGFIDGVVVSGGEPTIDAGLPAFLSLLKESHLQVKLASNGLAPKVIAVYQPQQLFRLAEQAGKYVDQVQVRGVWKSCHKLKNPRGCTPWIFYYR